MSDYKNLLVDRIGTGDRIARVTLNCPEKANALSDELIVTGTEAVEIGMINYAWPGAELDERTLAFAERTALVSSDHLAMLKPTMNRFHENMGIHSSIRSATEQDVMAQMTEFACEFNRQFEEQGLKAAIEWRDRPYDRKSC